MSLPALSATSASYADLVTVRREEWEALKRLEAGNGPGISLRESPRGVRRLGFTWFDEKKVHHFVEMAIVDNHPLMVAGQLAQMAAGIEERFHDPSIAALRTEAKGGA